MRNFLIGLLGGVASTDYHTLDQLAKLAATQHKDLVNLMVAEHDSAMRQAVTQIEQQHELYRQTVARLERVEEERANASVGWTVEKEEHQKLKVIANNEYLGIDALKRQKNQLLDGFTKIMEERDALKAERDELKAKLSRPKPRKEPTMAERPY